MTSTVAGISRAVRPSRLALSATVLVLSGVVAASLAPACAGAGFGAGDAVLARLARPARCRGLRLPALGGRDDDGLEPPRIGRGVSANRPSTIRDEDKKVVRTGEHAKSSRPGDA